MRAVHKETKHLKWWRCMAGTFKLYSDTSSITPPQLVIE